MSALRQSLHILLMMYNLFIVVVPFSSCAMPDDFAYFVNRATSGSFSFPLS
jgi:hypothetical protein